MTESDDTAIPDYMARQRIDGRRYVVLGAGQGIGRQVAHALTQAGAAAIVTVDIDAERAADIAEEIGIGVAWSGDVTKRAEVQRLAAFTAERFDRLDGFVDIIGVSGWSDILDISDEMWDSQFDLGLRHAFLASQELGRLLVDGGGGTMVFVASVSGLTGAPMHAAYGAAKAALISWVQSLAVELGPRRVRANAVAPGSILTPRSRQNMSDERIEQTGRMTPLGTIGQPSDIAGAVLFFTTDQSSHVTGRTLVVDGGVMSTFHYLSLIDMEAAKRRGSHPE
jgi:NAD(P)-dependent dehydrogenase (short-subunit alcohol dehydrogenase family)